MERTLRVVVIGGGIVGLTTGLALRKAGMDVIICERSPEIRAAGTSLGLWRNALTVFERLGVGEQVQAIGRTSEMWMHDARGTLIETPGFDTDDHTFLLVDRAKLNTLLADGVGRANIRLDAAFTHYTEDADSVTAHFSDGTTEQADLLVGADGLYSKVREQLIPGASAQVHAGHKGWRALLPAGEFSVDEDVISLGHNRTRGGYLRTRDGETYWLLQQFDSPEMTGTKKDQALERARDLDDGGWNWRLPALIAATPEEAIYYHDVMIVPPLPRWTSARVTIAGDAAHAMSPHVTAGASLGIEDGAVLADRLVTRPALRDALRDYEADRIPHYRHVAELSRAVEHAATPAEYALHYVAFSHWMINQSADVARVTR